jgi:hypothetical protein
MTAGDAYTIACRGVLGDSGNGDPARKAKFATLGGVTTDRYGNVIFSDWGAG